jgi:hypothetical protein
MAAKKCLAISSQAGNQTLQSKDNRYSAEYDDQDKEEEQLPDATTGGDRARNEGVPGNNGPKEDKHAAIKQQVDNCWEWKRSCLFRKPAIVSKSNASSKCDQEVIATEDGAYSNT